MEEHFNENYAESDNYPMATFSGKISDYSKSLLDIGEHEITLKGSLEFHGVKREVIIEKCQLISDKKSLILIGSMVLLASEFEIEIPKIVAGKLRDDVKVNLRFELSPQD